MNNIKKISRYCFLHTIDPVHDSVAVLREYARQIGIKSSKGRFVTGDKDRFMNWRKTVI